MTTPLGQRIAAARKANGWTQEEMAERTNLTVRTIQRLENQMNEPRLHTLRVLAQALAVPLETLRPSPTEQSPDLVSENVVTTSVAERNFMRLLNLSSFSYLLIPVGHFFVPLYLLRKKDLHYAPYREVGWEIVRTQLGWNLGTSGVMLLTVCYNLMQASYSQRPLYVSYMLPFVGMYLLNGWLIYRQQKKVMNA